MTITESGLIGKSVQRTDVMDKVTGCAVFVDDIQFGPNLLYSRLVRSPYPHALIKKIDTSKAEALPGVRAVVTGKDLTARLGLYLIDRPIFAYDRVRVYGEPVAGVVATSEDIAIEAVKLVEVEYEVLPAIYDPVESAQPDAPLIHPDLGSYSVVNFIFPEPGTNISEHFKIRKGDAEAAFAACEAVVEGRFRLPPIEHVPLETHTSVALCEKTGQVTLWATSQSPFAMRDMIAQSLGISHNKLRVIAPLVGGGFGGKAGVTMEACAVVMAQAVEGRPVKLRLTREEEFVGTSTRQSLISDIKVGCDKDGNLQAME
ncbi:MAG: molybdopterin-dependent oxidoreductase, partial [Anaerolineales bacterium]|nr:molybdopterin-dependent oxidoreductase [Anaerolineales bacterium]